LGIGKSGVGKTETLRGETSGRPRREASVGTFFSLRA
jgi:hypothetical protein